MKRASAMAAAGLLLLVFSLPGARAEGDGSAVVHPVQRVIGLLQGLSAKAKSEGEFEEVQYSKFELWCTNSMKSLSEAISEEKDSISALNSKIESLKGEKVELNDAIVKLEAQLGEMDKAGVAAKSDRDEGRKLYEAAMKDYDATIDAIVAANKALKESSTGGSEAAMVLLASPQVQGALERAGAVASQRQGAALAALLRQANVTVRPELQAEGDYEAHVQKYDFKSSSVIELLKELQAKFEEDRLNANKEETNAESAYLLAKQARDTLILAAKASKDAKITEFGQVKEDLVTAEGEVSALKQDLEADEGSLATTQTDCSSKKQEWEERSAVRSQEIEAIAAAVGILEKATGVSIKTPSNPVPPPPPSAVAEGGISLLQVADPREKVMNLLRSTAAKTHSHALERLAQELQVMPKEPFDVVVNEIQKMIFHLMQEQKDEDDHKDWCDMELDKSKASESNKEDKLASLKLRIKTAEATVGELSLGIQEAQEMVAQITSFMQEATKIRKAGKAENAVAVKDAEDAQSALADATAVLETFYKQSGMVVKESWELLQQPVTLPAHPATWESPYTGVADPVNQPYGIVSVLQRVASEFAAMEAETRAQEETDQKDYEESIKTSEIEKARREKDVELKTQEKKRLNDKIVSLRKSSKHTAGELDAVKQYLKDLSPACIEGDSTYPERKAARAQEMDALRRSQSILQGAFDAKEVADVKGEPIYSTGKYRDSMSTLPLPAPKFLQVRRHAPALQ